MAARGQLDLEELRGVAARAVQAGMDVVRDWRGGAEEVAAVERATEAAAIAVLRGSDPVTPVVGEVSGGDAGAARVWVVDPVDGTTNLARGDSFVAVTLALLVNGRPVAGATGSPFTGEWWAAAADRGAYDRAGHRLELVERPRRPRVVLDPATSLPEHLAAWDEAHHRLTSAFGAVEHRSALALALTYVAAGAFDGVVHVGGSPVQDFAAGVLLVREAGGVVTGLDGSDDVWRSRVVVAAGAPSTYRELREVLRGVPDR